MYYVLILLNRVISHSVGINILDHSNSFGSTENFELAH